MINSAQHAAQIVPALAPNGASDIAPFTANGKSIPESTFQALALNTQQNVVIEACAGSGKTWLLVARMLKLLLQGVSPAHIVAITFTRKAAQEMKARLADMLDSVHGSALGDGASLLAAMNLPQDDSTQAAIATAWQRCRAQGEWPSIMTFHEWFGELRQNAPLSSLANIGTRLSDDETALKTQAWQQFWEDTQSSAALQSDMQLAVAYLGLNTFEHALNAMMARRAEWQVYTQHLQSQQAEPNAISDAELAQQAYLSLSQPACATSLWESVRALAPRLNQIAKQYAASKTATALHRGQDLQAAFDHIKATSAPMSEWAVQSHITLLMQPLSLSGGAVVNTKIYKDMQANLAQFLGGADGFEAEIDALHAALQSLYHQASVLRLMPVHQAVLACGSHLIAAYQSNKQAQGAMDFTDLEIDALALLAQPNTEKDSNAVTRHVLLDEFQDTNPVQWQSLQAFVLPLLTEAAAGGQPGSIFVVGDPKQSIYRFRRADPKLFSHVQHSLQTQFGAVLLKTQRTRRNALAVNDWVNAVFAPQPAQTLDAAAALFTTQFTLSTTTGLVGVLPLLDAEALGNSESEAQQALQALLAWKVRNPQLDWSHAMVLARKRQALAPIAAALHAQGIASVSAERGGFFALPEIADAIHLLTALNNPADALALLSALRSPLFAVTDAQLSELLVHSSTAFGQRWLGVSQLASPWAQGVSAWLRSWQVLCSTLPMHDALDAMMHQAQWAQRFAINTPERSREIAANLAQLLQVSLAVNQGRYPSLPRFVHAVAQLRDSDAMAAQSNAHLNAVRLSTIHGAKGLEADCVLMVDLYSRDKADDTVKVLLDWPAEQAYPGLFAMQLCPAPVLAAIAPLAKVLDAQEQARLTERDTLLYVAMTRAVSELWISATVKKNSSTVYERMHTALAAVGLTTVDNPLPSDPVNLQALPNPAEFVSELPSLASLLAPAPAFVKTPVDSNQASSQALGTLMHSLLEHFLRFAAWPNAASLSITALGLSVPIAMAQTVLTRCQAMAQILGLEQMGSHADYIAIEAPLYHQAQQLRPDVVAYHTASKAAWVIDYKYSFAPDDELANVYAQQLTRYASAIQGTDYVQVGCFVLTLAGQCWGLQTGQWVLCSAPWQQKS